MVKQTIKIPKYFPEEDKKPIVGPRPSLQEEYLRQEEMKRVLGIVAESQLIEDKHLPVDPKAKSK